MSFKDILSKLDQLSEADVKHKGTYGTSYGKEDVRDQYGHKVGSVDKDTESKKDAPKRGRGRPKKGADDSGEVKKYDWSAFGSTGKDVKLPKWDKSKTTKHSLKEYFDDMDRALKEAEQLTIEPAKQNTQVIRQGTKTLGTVSNPQLAQQIKQSIGKGEMSLTGSDLGEEAEDYSATRARAGKDIGKPGKQFAKIAKSAGERYGSTEKGKKVAGAILAKLRGLREADLPPQDGLMGAGLGAGRDQEVAEGKKPDFLDLDKDGNKTEPMKKAAKDKKKVDEGMEHRLKAAHHRGKAHALAKESYNCKYDDMEEARMYHEGFKEGLDECYGQVPIRGQVVGEQGDVVDDMASFGAHTPAMEDEMEEGNAFTAALAKTPKGGKFTVGGKTFTDTSNLEEVDSMFESWDNQLGSLLEEYKEIQEGLSVSVSKGQQGAPDSVTVSAQDQDADKLLALVKSAGLGLFGDENSQAEVGVPTSGEQHGGVDVVGDHDGMMALIKKTTGDTQPGTLQPASSDEDYADEEGEQADDELGMLKKLTQAIGGVSHEHEHTNEETCNECGMLESECGGTHGKEVVDEVESEDQQEYEVAEANAPDSGEEEFEATDDEIAKDNAAASSHGGADDEESDEENEDEEDKEDKDLEESYANSDDDKFQADIDFMTKIISGGLNKQKSTGQTTTPVIAGQSDRMGYNVQESVSDWKKLAGLK